MKKSKFWLCLGLVLLVAGIAFASVGKVMGASLNMRFDWNSFKIETASKNFVTETVKVSDFSRLDLTTSTIDVTVKPGDEYAVSYHVNEDFIPEITNNNGTLTVKTKKQTGFMFFNFWNSTDEDEYIIITVPENKSRSLDIESSTADIVIQDLDFSGKIETSTGDITLSNLKADAALELQVSTGDIYIKNCKLDSLYTEASTGQVNISNSEIKGKYQAETSTGDITLNSSTVDSVLFNGSTSDIKFQSTVCKNINIETSTGDISLGLKGNKDDYSIKFSTSTGDMIIDGDEIDGKHFEASRGSNMITIDTSTGDIDISFTN